MAVTQGGKACENGAFGEEIYQKNLKEKFPNLEIIEINKNEFIKNNNGIFIFKGYEFQIDFKRAVKPDFSIMEIKDNKIIRIFEIIEVKTKESTGSDRHKYIGIGSNIKFIINTFKEQCENTKITVVFGGLLNLTKYEERYIISSVKNKASKNEILCCLEDAEISISTFLNGYDIEKVFI